MDKSLSEITGLWCRVNNLHCKKNLGLSTNASGSHGRLSDKMYIVVIKIISNRNI